MRTSFILLAWGSLLAIGCQPRSADSANSTSNTKESLPVIKADAAPTEAEKSKLLAAKDLLFTRLTGRLMEAMSATGAAGAIKVCQVEANSIAMEVGKEANVHIGRTGVRLRNVSNTSPAWAQSHVTEKTETPVYAKLSNGHAVALLPIKLLPQCLMCHGPKEQLALDVKEQLATLYPEDQATGFSEGELRGWFWVELLD
jgi:Protein of unknown function (DUF3365)